MHKAFKHLRQLDFAPHPAEDNLRALFKDTDLEHQVTEARAAGVPWLAIMGVVIQAAPLAEQMLALLLAALKTNPPDQQKAEQAMAEAKDRNTAKVQEARLAERPAPKRSHRRKADAEDSQAGHDAEAASGPEANPEDSPAE